MALNYAQIWQPDLLPIKIQESMTSPFIVTNVKWMGARTFHFTQMSTSGYRNHSRSGGWKKGKFAQEDNAYTVQHSRDIEFLVDKADVDETNATASIQNIAMTFQKIHATPELDAKFFHNVAQKALTLTGFNSATAAADYTADNVLTKLKGFISKVKKYRPSLICYVDGHIMDKLELSTQLQRKIEMTTIADGGIGIETRFTTIDGVVVLEMWDEGRFYSKFDFKDDEDGGFAPAVDAKKLNVVIASTDTVITVPKINSIYFFEPGAHTQGDGWLYQQREDWDTFIFPNGKDNKIDSIYVDTVA